jgi:hypothetical protein
MIIFRILCAVLIAWSINWSLGRPPAAELLVEVPEMAWIGPIGGALAGLVILSRRQGHGVLIGIANGAYSGLFAVILSAVMFLTMRMTNTIWHNLLKNFEDFLRVLDQEADPLMANANNWPLIGFTLGACAVSGLVSEGLKWSFVWIRRMRQDDSAAEV